MYSSKNVSRIYFVKYFKVKKTALWAIFKSISAGNRHCWRHFHSFLYIPVGLEGLFDSLHHHLLARHSPLQ
jgi:hypothetical protein